MDNLWDLQLTVMRRGGEWEHQSYIEPQVLICATQEQSLIGPIGLLQLTGHVITPTSLYQECATPCKYN